MANRKKTMLPPEYIAIAKHVNATNKSKTAVPCVGLAPIGSTSIVKNLEFGNDAASGRGQQSDGTFVRRVSLAKAVKRVQSMFSIYSHAIFNIYPNDGMN